MKELEILLTRFWIVKEFERDLYFQVKNEISKFEKFVNEVLGYKLIVNEKLIKLEKIPGSCEIFMGIQDFTETLDYEMFCLFLMFLEMKDEGEQFLLSELTEFIETNGEDEEEGNSIDWTVFSHRRSLVRVFKFAEKMYIIKVYEGDSESFSSDEKAEVLYANTGISRYFSISFPYDITKCERCEDFLNLNREEFDLDRGSLRSNRVYRRLILSPAVFWSENEDADYDYIKKQRGIIGRNMDQYLNAQFRVHKNGAFLAFDEERLFKTHPSNSGISDIVLFVCREIQKNLDEGKFTKDMNDFISVPKNIFESMLIFVKKEYSKGFSKEYAEASDKKFYNEVLSYMIEWMFCSADDESIVILPSAGLFEGIYKD